MNWKAAPAADAPQVVPAETLGARKVKAGLLLGFAAIGLASACGARSPLLATEEVDGGAQQDGAGWVGVSDSDQPAPTASVVGGSPDSAITGPVQTVDASPPMVLDATSAACTQKSGGGGGSGAPGDCTVTFIAMCGGTNYQVVCECPRRTCVCFGPTTHVVDYTGCPSCGRGPNPGDPYVGPPTDQVLALCGFPH